MKTSKADGKITGAKTTSPQEVGVQIALPSIQINHLILKLQGTNPLIVHKWSEKAKREILDKQQKKANKAKEIRNPQAEYESAMYHHPDGGYGFPAVAFKAAAIQSVSQISGLTKVFTRGTFHVLGELVKIQGEPKMREDMVRIGPGTADYRFRPEFPQWSAELHISYNANVITPEQLANLFNIAGYSVGVGEMRPGRTAFNYGTWQVV